MRFTFEETLTGGLRVDGADRDAPVALVIRGRAPGLGALLRRPMLSIEGELDAEGLARQRPLCGSIDLVSPHARGATYAFTFTGDDARRYAFEGTRALAPGARIASLTVLVGEVRAEGGAVLGQALLRFDLRTDALRCFRSFQFVA
jgi:hypothetical protein